MRRLTPTAASSPLLIAGILLIATTLRAPITEIGPLMSQIRSAFDLGSAEAGVLTTLPLLAFAAISPFAALLAREYGIERSLFAAMVLMSVGILVRSAGTAWCLYLGTAIIGSSIAIGNVLLPSLLMRDFPNRIATLTAIYALTMGAAAALASLIAVPLAHIPGFGWPLALGAIVVLPLGAATLWISQIGSRTAPAKRTPSPPHRGRIWHSPLAWQVTLFLGLNSFVYYVAVSWLPSILTDAEFTPAKAGSLHGVLQLSTAVPGLLLVPIVGRLRDQRLVALCVSLLAAVGLAGLSLDPSAAVLWTIIFGAGTGAGIVLGLSFLSLRAATAHQAAALSGMAQCIGYLLAAGGPPLVGALREAEGSWSTPLLVCSTLCVVMGIFGLLAGRAIRIGQHSRHGASARNRQKRP